MARPFGHAYTVPPTLPTVLASVDHVKEMLVHLDGLDRQLDALDRDLEQIAQSERWASIVEILARFKGVSTRTAGSVGGTV